VKRLIEFFKRLFVKEPESEYVHKVTIVIERYEKRTLASPLEEHLKPLALKKEKIVLEGDLRLPKNSGWRTIGERTEYRLIVLGKAPSVVHQH
jgi:hypothetical protein